MKAEIVELQKSKLSSSVKLTEPRDSNVQHENATAPTCDQFDDESILLRCKDIHDILAYFPEMELIREDLTIICRVCIPKNTTLSCPTGSALPAGMFSVRESMDKRDTDIMSRAFRNLKISISRHLKRDAHKDAISQNENTTIKMKNESNRNNAIALRVGCACYKIYYRGRPYTDYEDQVFLLHKCGVDVGDINHSYKFPQKFLESVAEVVKDNVKCYLKNPLPQTGFAPPVKVLADKATYKHRTRQFVGLTSIIPDSDDLLQYMFLGLPVVKLHTGEGVGQSIISVLEEFEISAEQFQGGSFGGQYFHLSVPDVLNTHFGTEEKDASVHYDHDPMHKAGLVDTHIREDDNFKFLNKVTEVVAAAFKNFNWGKNYEALAEACESLGQVFASPARYSTTRFANSVRKVYMNFRQDYCAIVQCLEMTKTEKRDGDSKDRQKAADAEKLMKSICNVKFVLTLSAITDIYDKYGELVNVVQKVNYLPHERFDTFIHVCNEMKSMSERMNHEKCDAKFCSWPVHHRDLKELDNTGEYMGVPIVDHHDKEVPNVTRSSAKRAHVNNADNVRENVSKQVLLLITRLEKDLRDQVFSQSDKEMIEDTRLITDLKTTAIRTKSRGAILISNIERAKYITTLRKIIPSVREVPDETIILQFQEFLVRLEHVARNKKNDDLDSKDLIKLFLRSDKELYKGIEMIIHSICVSAVKISVESVIESLTSKFEIHFNKFRNVTEGAAYNEMMVSINGPSPAQCDKVVMAAMKQHFKGQYGIRFVRRTNDMISLLNTVGVSNNSKVINRMQQEKSRLPFMQ